MTHDQEPFGGKIMVVSGDHRQILPVLKDAARAETLKACFKSSPLWGICVKYVLPRICACALSLTPESAEALAEFSKFLLQIGEGRYPVNTEISENDICLPSDMCIIPDDRRSEQASAGEPGEAEDMEEFSNFKLLPLIENTSRVDPTETNDDRRKRNVNALIDAVYPGIDVHDLRTSTSWSTQF